MSDAPLGVADAAMHTRALARLLIEEGIPGEARVAGFRQEIAVVRTSAAHVAAVEGLADRIRALGFRYVAVDLETLAATDA